MCLFAIGGRTGAAGHALGVVPERVLVCIGIGVGVLMVFVAGFIGAVVACSVSFAGAVVATALGLRVGADVSSGGGSPSRLSCSWPAGG